MPRSIDLNSRYSRRVRPPSELLDPWTPGKAGLTILGLLSRYRYMTRELLALVYPHHRSGRGSEEIKNHLGRLWKHGYVERFFRPAALGSRQYVYVLRPEGARLLIPTPELPERWPAERFKVYNRMKPKSDYEHALAVTLLQILWDLGAPQVAGEILTQAYWVDRDGDKKHRTNSFAVQVEGKNVVLNPDSTVWIGWRQKDYFQPLFIEIERTHKNAKRTAQRFRAYQALLTRQHDVVEKACRADVDPRITKPVKGVALFIAADREHRERLRQVAVEVIGATSRNNAAVPEFWFSSLEDFYEDHAGEEQIIPPAELFRRPLAVRLNGKPWSIIST